MVPRGPPGGAKWRPKSLLGPLLRAIIGLRSPSWPPRGAAKNLFWLPEASPGRSGRPPGSLRERGRRPEAAQRAPGSHFGAILVQIWLDFRINFGIISGVFSARSGRYLASIFGSILEQFRVSFRFGRVDIWLLSSAWCSCFCSCLAGCSFCFGLVERILPCYSAWAKPSPAKSSQVQSSPGNLPPSP